MLQRAASNAYSWWWASHIRTKQSKWLEQSLQDMEEKVQHVIKLIEEDGDSFAKRAEMYYKKRPELLQFVEESYRAFRALAERYDHLSNDLQKANHTIATVFPEEVQFAMDEDDECGGLKFPKNSQVPTINAENIPTAPKAPIKISVSPIKAASKQFPAKKLSKSESTHKNAVKSGLSKSEALEEIDKLQKEILALQTVKEFVKSNYEIGLEKYWGIENQIMEMQQKVGSLQDEFGVVAVIEDDEARTLMAKAALKSCQETLDQLKEKQEKSTIDAKEEYTKIEDIGQRLKFLRRESIPDENNVENQMRNDKPELVDESKILIEEVEERPQMEAMKEKMNENMEEVSMESLTVTELVEKIDGLANKVINLETEVSSQNVLIYTLRTDVDDLQAQIQILEHENETRVAGTHNLTIRVNELEGKLHTIQDLSKNVQKQNRNLQTNFVEARSSLDHLSKKLRSVKLDEEVEVVNILRDEERTGCEVKPPEGLSTMRNENTKDEGEEDIKEQIVEESVHSQQEEGNETAEECNVVLDSKQDEQVSMELTDQLENEVLNQQGEGIEATKLANVDLESKSFEQVSMKSMDQTGNDILNTEQQRDMEKENELDWQQKLLSGLGDREKILLTEYTTILRNYKEVKRKLSDMEKKDLESQFEMTVHLRELRDTISKRDDEIQHLRRKLNHQQGTFGENKDLKEDISPVSETLVDQENKSEAPTEVLEVQEDLISVKEDDLKFVVDQAPAISAVEEKLRMDIDAILEENLDFWLRFSTAFHLIQKFEAEVEDLQNEISKIEEKKRGMGGNSMDLKSEVRPIYKHLREIQTELTMWLERSVSLNEELKRRLESLCSIQEQITVALKEGVEEDEIKFSSHQAAKFQGEVLNMKQENNKVSEELQAGLDHVNALQLEIEKTLRKLNDEFEIPGNQAQPQLSHSESRARIPLRAFIFGNKQKKEKHSIFSSMLLNRRYQFSRHGDPL